MNYEENSGPKRYKFPKFHFNVYCKTEVSQSSKSCVIIFSEICVSVEIDSCDVITVEEKKPGNNSGNWRT